MKKIGTIEFVTETDLRIGNVTVVYTNHQELGLILEYLEAYHPYLPPTAMSDRLMDDIRSILDDEEDEDEKG